MKTEAFVLSKIGPSNDAFSLQPVQLRPLNSDDVIIETEAFGLNYADVMARQGLYRETPPLPCVIGYEVVGKVLQVATTENEHLLGKRVIAITHFGGYAKHAIAPIKTVFEIGNLNANTALALTTQGVTAYYMANYIAPIQKNDKVLIHAAAGGVGTLLIQLAKLAGATVFAKVSSTEKAEKCKQLGADYTINYKQENYSEKIQSILGEQKIDVCYNPIGGSTFKQDKQLLTAGSRLFLFGGSQLAEGKKGMLSQLNFLRKMGVLIPAFMMMQSRTIIGVNMLKIAMQRPDVLKQCLEGIVTLHANGSIQTENGGEFRFDQLAQAHDLLQSGKSIGKISIHW